LYSEKYAACPVLLADRALLTHALFNLLENAIKYRPAGSRITVHVSYAEGWLSCEIVDQGKGIAADKLPRLFSQYQRLVGFDPRQIWSGAGGKKNRSQGPVFLSR
jgi:signal transduction histidine kinase